MKKIVRDIRRTYDLSKGGRLRRLIECYRSPGVHAAIVFRFGHWLLLCSVFWKILLLPLYLYLYHRMRWKWGIMIQRDAEIGPGFYIGHFGGIFVSGGSKIGEN